MVILTNEQVIEMQSKLDKMNEIVDAMLEESVSAIKNLAGEKRSLEREVERLKNRLKSTEEELAMSQKALVNSNDSGLLEAECHCNEQEDDWWQEEPFSYNDLPDHDS